MQKNFFSRKNGNVCPYTCQVEESGESSTTRKKENIMFETCFLHNSEHRVSLRSGSLLVSQGQEIIGTHPLETLERIVVFGNPQITTQALKSCLETGIEVQYYSQYGKYLGMIYPHVFKDTSRRLAQYRLVSDNSIRLAWGKAIIKAKLKTYELEYRRMLDNGWHPSKRDFLPMIHQYEEQLDKACSDKSLMGIEGMSAKTYYNTFSECLPEGWAWNGRHYHPATDEINALLSLTYALATGYLESQCRQHGLDPTLSFLHRLGYGSGGLATDLVEIFRVSVCDHGVLKALRGRKIGLSDFKGHEEEFLLTAGGFKRYMGYYHNSLEPLVEKLSKKLFTVLSARLTDGEIPNFLQLQPER